VIEIEGNWLLGLILMAGLNWLLLVIVLLLLTPFGTARMRVWWTWRPWVLRAAWAVGRHWRRWHPTTRVKRLDQ
jgi:hypothetical protein